MDSREMEWRMETPAEEEGEEEEGEVLLWVEVEDEGGDLAETEVRAGKVCGGTGASILAN